MGAALIAISPDEPVHLGIDNATTVQEYNSIIKLLRGRAETKLENEDGSMVLGGVTSPLQAQTLYERIWAITKK